MDWQEISFDRQAEAVRNRLERVARASCGNGVVLMKKQATPVCRELRAAVKEANRYVSTDPDLALQILTVAWRTSVQFLEMFIEDPERFWTINEQIADSAGKAAGEIAGDKELKEKWVPPLLELASHGNDMMMGNSGLALLKNIAVLADEETEPQFQKALKKAGGYGDEPAVVAREIIRHARGEAASEEFAQTNGSVGTFVEEALAEAMARKDYEEAERIARKGLADRRIPGAFHVPLEEALYDVYEQAGWRSKMEEQARRLVVHGFMDYYLKLKEMLTADGRWEEEFPKLLAECEKDMYWETYMDLLEYEKEYSRLLELMEKYPHKALEYGDELYPEYPDQVAKMGRDALLDFAGRASKRPEYKRLGQYLVRLAEIGAVEEAAAVTDEILKANSKKRAMKEELERAERKIASMAKAEA